MTETNKKKTCPCTYLRSFVTSKNTDIRYFPECDFTLLCFLSVCHKFVDCIHVYFSKFEKLEYVVLIGYR